MLLEQHFQNVLMMLIVLDESSNLLNNVTITRKLDIFVLIKKQLSNNVIFWEKIKVIECSEKHIL